MADRMYRIEPITSKAPLTPDETQATRMLLHSVANARREGRTLCFLTTEQAQALHDFADGLIESDGAMADVMHLDLSELDTLDGHPFTANQAETFSDPTA